MSETNSRAARNALRSIQREYGFMLERGYEAVSVEDFDLGWQVTLRKQNVFARIVRSRGEEEMYFRRDTQPPDDFTDIGSVIYAATGEYISRSKSSDTKVIKQYLDRIEAYFEGEYLRNEDGLRAAREEYEAASRKEYYAMFPQEVAATPGTPPAPPERKSILYYPLLGVIIILILGALLTLVMVLADRLFAIF